jgi:hypothetical protein
MSRPSIATLSCLLAAGCADEDPATPPLAPVIAEACLHAQHGPYRDQTASADLLGTVSAVDRPHTAYRVALPAAGDGYRGAVVYTPRHDALHAFLLSGDPDVELRDGADRITPTIDRAAIGDCPELSQVVTAELAADQPYRLILGHETAPGVLLVIENVEEIVP